MKEHALENCRVKLALGVIQLIFQKRGHLFVPYEFEIPSSSPHIIGANMTQFTMGVLAALPDLEGANVGEAIILSAWPTDNETAMFADGREFRRFDAFGGRPGCWVRMK